MHAVASPWSVAGLTGIGFDRTGSHRETGLEIARRLSASTEVFAQGVESDAGARGDIGLRVRW
jgi:hypothetical protein